MTDTTSSPSSNGLIMVQIPAKDEEDTIAEVITNIPREINKHQVKVIVIDDNSRDSTAAVAIQAGSDYIINRKKSEGLGVAFRTGIEECLRLGADIIVNIDADNQFNPKDIPQLVLPIIRKEADMVTASRFLNPQLTKNIPPLTRWGNRRFTKLISRITGHKFTDTQCGFRAYSREAALRMNLRGKFTYTQEVFIDLAEKGIKIQEVSVPVVYYRDRKSLISGNLRRYGFRSLGIIGRATRDTQPMKFFGVPGLILFLLGFILGSVYFIYWLFQLGAVPTKTIFGFTVFFMVSGMALLILALLADMLKTINRNQQEILYKLKKQEFNKRQ